MAAPPGGILRRQVHRELPVAAGGQAEATVVAPTDPAMQAVAEQLAALLKELTGAAAPVVTDAAVTEVDGHTLRTEYRGRPLTLVGNALNNRAIFPLYCRWVDASDGAYPVTPHG